MKPAQWLQLVVAVLVLEGVGLLGAAFTAPAIGGWYQGLAKPFLNPPSWIFGPVWTALYAVMGVALFLVWRQGWGRIDMRRAVRLFALQLVLNAAWSPIFFGMHNPALALFDIVLLWLAILATIAAFWNVSRAAA